VHAENNSENFSDYVSSSSTFNITDNAILQSYNIVSLQDINAHYRNFSSFSDNF